MSVYLRVLMMGLKSLFYIGWLAGLVCVASAHAAAPCNDLNEAEGPTPGVCESLMSGDHQLFTLYHPNIHDIPGNSQVINRGLEEMSGSQVVSATSTNPGYSRKIHGCVPPYTVNTSTHQCEFKRENHACNAGDAAGGISASEVSAAVAGANQFERFQNAVNKKLACCLNEFGSSASVDATVKFDCIENSKKIYADFNELWASSDDQADGGQLNALLLTNALGKPITGFFSLNGSRCNEYHEFGGEIQPGRVSASGKTDQFTAVGSPVEMPSSSGYQYLRQRLSSNGSGSAKVPTTVAEKRRCPILVRAATAVQCPTNPPPTSAQKNLDEYDASGVILRRRCSIASSVQVQIRIEQIWEIENQSKMITEDTVIDAKNAATISVDRIMANKYGNQCPPGTTRSGDACVY